MSDQTQLECALAVFSPESSTSRLRCCCCSLEKWESSLLLRFWKGIIKKSDLNDRGAEAQPGQEFSLRSKSELGIRDRVSPPPLSCYGQVEISFLIFVPDGPTWISLIGNSKSNSSCSLWHVHPEFLFRRFPWSERVRLGSKLILSINGLPRWHWELQA